MYAALQTIVLHMKRLNQIESDFRDFVCSLFPKAMLFDFYSIESAVEKKRNTLCEISTSAQSSPHFG